MRKVAGTKGSLGDYRTTNANSTNVGCTADSPQGIEIRVKSGAAKLDSIVVHYEADAEFNNAMPTDVTKIHG